MPISFPSFLSSEVKKTICSHRLSHIEQKETKKKKEHVGDRLLAIQTKEYKKGVMSRGGKSIRCMSNPTLRFMPDEEER